MFPNSTNPTQVNPYNPSMYSPGVSNIPTPTPMSSNLPNVSPLIRDRVSTEEAVPALSSEATGPYIFILLDQTTLAKIRDNLMKVLQKIGSGPITRMLHPVVEKNKYKFTAGLVNMETNVNVPSSSSIQGDKLNGFYINIYEVLEPEDRTLITTILNVIQEINTNKAKITDNNDYILSQLVKNKNELSNELVSRINYFKMIDIMYMEYMTVLVKVIKHKQNIFKIMETTSNILGLVLSSLIQKMGGNNPEIPAMTQKIVLLYLIQHFSTSSDGDVKMFLYKSNIISEEEYKNYIKVKTIEDLSKYLTVANILNISPNSLRNNFKSVLGNIGLELLEGRDLEKLIAYIILNKKPNAMYSTYLNSNTYKANIDSLETLLLNAKSYLIVN